MRQDYQTTDLQEILEAFPGMDAVDRQYMFTSGFENSNYYIGAGGGEYVLKIFETPQIVIENVLFEIDMMKRIHASGTKVPHVRDARDGKSYTLWRGKPAILMDFIAGKNLEKTIISDRIAAGIGFEAGKMDLALKSIRDGSKTRQGYEFDLKNFLMLEDKIRFLPDSFDKDIFKTIFSEFKKIKPDFDQLPAGLIHNDIVLHNLLAEGDRLAAIIDFSDIVFSPYIQNIAVALAQCFFTYNWQPHQAGIFLAGYQKSCPLSAEEKGMLRRLVQARFATLVVEFNHWNIVFGEDAARTSFIMDNDGFLRRFLSMSAADFEACCFTEQ